MKILFFFFLWMLTMLLVNAFGIRVVLAVYGIDLLEPDFDNVGVAEEPLYQKGYWLLTVIRNLGIYALTAITFLELTEKEPFRFLRLKSGINKRAFWLVVFGVSAGIGAILIQVGTEWLLERFGRVGDDLDEVSETTQRISEIVLQGGWYNTLVNILLLGVLVPFCEELLFRGALQTYLIKVSRKAIHGVLITAFIFALIHGEFDGFLVRFGMGVALGMVYIWSGSLWSSILVHAAYNTTQIVLVYMEREGLLAEEAVKIMPAIGLLIAGITVYLLYRQRTIDPSDWLSK